MPPPVLPACAAHASAHESKRPRLAGARDESQGGVASIAAPAEADGTVDKGRRMMMKMGWTEGQGLGKDGQGMRTPLVVKKTDSATAIIVHAPAKRTHPLPPPQPSANSAPQKSVVFRGRPSRVLLLRNMASPGEADADLAVEIGEECSKYGDVLKVTILEMPASSDVPPDEVVRIFVQFATQGAAIAGYIDLDGRFFDQRSVLVAFYPETEFENEQFGL